jgi:hypothetical protein
MVNGFRDRDRRLITANWLLLITANCPQGLIWACTQLYVPTYIHPDVALPCQIFLLFCFLLSFSPASLSLSPSETVTFPPWPNSLSPSPGSPITFCHFTPGPSSTASPSVTKSSPLRTRV